MSKDLYGNTICELCNKGKCMHSWSEGELECRGTNEEMSECMHHIEAE